MAIGSFSQNGDVPLANKVGREFLRDRGSSPPGSSRRAGGYSPVLRLTADEMSPPLFPCPKKFTFWDTTLLPRGTFWVRVRAGPLGRPKAVFLLLACCTQEEDAGPGGNGMSMTDRTTRGRESGFRNCSAPWQGGPQSQPECRPGRMLLMAG